MAAVTAVLSTHANNTGELHKPNIHGRAAIADFFIRETNAKLGNKCCYNHTNSTLDNWKYVVWSDESSFTLFPANGRVYVWIHKYIHRCDT